MRTTRVDGRVAVEVWVCDECGEEFTPHARRDDRRFCSRTCANRHWAKTSRATRAAPVRELQCAQCGETFTAKRSDAKYCGPACRQRARRVALPATQ